jgi:outer membrane biosynthesis protein TonB
LQSSSPSLSTLLARFRTSYPTGSLISDFLTVHDGNYAIRALVQVGGTVLASGMAAHPNLETAEDQAKVRALEALGLTPSAPYPLPQWELLDSPAPVVTPIKPPSLDHAPPIPKAETPIAKPQLEIVKPTIAPESPVEKTPEPPQADPEKDVKPKKAKTEDPAPAEETQDRSDEIARIGVEMKRLGWTTIQGRDYLKQRYGKRSRQELNDSELLDFLAYLESQPLPQ